MTNAIAELLDQICGKPQNGMQLAIAEAISADPLKVSIDGSEIFQFRINSDIVPEQGDKLLTLISDGEIYIICRLE